MDWTTCSAAKPQGAIGERYDYKGCSTDEPGSSVQERFPENESWWQPTDTRQDWGPSEKPTVVVCQEKGPMDLMSCHIEPQSRMSQQAQIGEETKEDEILEIMLTSRKKFYSQSRDIKIGSVIVDEVHYANDEKSRIFYINCGPDRFDTLDKYCKDTLLYEPDFENHDESKDDYVRVTKKKTVQRIHEGHYEETTEHKYNFPKSAKITFYVAMRKLQDVFALSSCECFRFCEVLKIVDNCITTLGDSK